MCQVKNKNRIYNLEFLKITVLEMNYIQVIITVVVLTSHQFLVYLS